MDGPKIFTYSSEQSSVKASLPSFESLEIGYPHIVWLDSIGALAIAFRRRRPRVGIIREPSCTSNQTYSCSPDMMTYSPGNRTSPVIVTFSSSVQPGIVLMRTMSLL